MSDMLTRARRRLGDCQSDGSKADIAEAVAACQSDGSDAHNALAVADEGVSLTGLRAKVQRRLQGKVSVCCQTDILHDCTEGELATGLGRNVEQVGRQSHFQTDICNRVEATELDQKCQSDGSNHGPGVHACARARTRPHRPGQIRPVRPVRLAPPSGTLLKYCRCIDCERWPAGCEINWTNARGVELFSPRAWHWCARYVGPRLIDDDWIVR